MLFTHALIVFVISAGFSFSQESRYQIIGGEDENFSWQEANAKAKNQIFDIDRTSLIFPFDFELMY